MFEIEIDETFEAAHTLPGTGTKCERMHGHAWRVQVGIEGEDLDANGLLVDFHDLRAITRSVLSEFDHTYLNELPSFGQQNPSAENLCRLIWQRVTEKLPRSDVRLTHVRVHETDRARATYREKHRS